MALHFRPTTIEELPAVGEFLNSFWSDPPSAAAEIAPAEKEGRATLQREHMIWKYYEQRLDWEGTRSYVLEENGRFAAHLAIMPGTLRLESGTISCTHFIDWVATPGQFLSGSVLLRKIAQMFDITFCIGGSADNRRLLPKLGFRPVGQPAALYARPVRPFRQILEHQTKDWRLPLRLARNFTYSVLPWETAGEWQAVPIQPRELPESLWHAPGAGGAAHTRTPATYEYFLRSKQPDFAFYVLEQNGRPSGGLCVAFPPGQARIADIWVGDASVEALALALIAAQRACMKRVGVHEVVFRASTPLLRQAAKESGLRFVKEDSIMTYPARQLDKPDIEAPLIVDDAAFLYSPLAPYLT